MGAENNPARDPMNGPNRLFLDRNPEALAYDRSDWPGSSSFHPPHINALFAEMLKAPEDSEPVQPELPFET